MDRDAILRQCRELRVLLVSVNDGRYLAEAQCGQANPHRQQDILEILTRAEDLLASLEAPMNSTPNAYQCPRCGTKGFTWQGLVAHKCDGVNRQTTAPLPAYPLDKRRLTKQELYRAKEIWSNG